MKFLLKEVKDRRIRVIANAGGVNLQACTEALRQIAADQGVDVSISSVVGDDMMKMVYILYICIDTCIY